MMGSGPESPPIQRGFRIGYVVPRYLPFVGGVETHVSHLATRLAALGCHVEVLTQEIGRGESRIEQMRGVTVKRFPSIVPAPNYAFAPGLWRYLAAHADEFDLLHAHSYHAFAALAAACTAQSPLVFTPHYLGTSESRWRRLLHKPYRKVGAHIFERAARVICVSKSEAALVCRHFPKAADRLVHIPNGVSLEAIQAARPFPTEKTVVLCVGRLERYKGVHRVLDAVARLDDTFVLRVIGSGPARKELEALPKTLGLGDRVEFLGAMEPDALFRWYRTAAVLVTLSTHEAFPIVPLEALVAGASVVASDIPAHREFVGGWGDERVRLVSLDSGAAALSDAIKNAALLPSRPVSIGAAATWDAVTERTLQMYREVVARDQKVA